MIAEALRLSVYFGESVASGPRLASDALMECFDRHGLTAATLLRGIEGFGLNRRIHAQRFPDVSTDLPLLAIAVDEASRIRAATDDVDAALPRGLVTLERTRLATGEDVAAVELPTGPGRAAKLTIHCASDERVGRRPAYRAVVDLLRARGAPGAIVLAGVDGRLYGRRRRARLLAAGGAPMTIISVGPREPLRRALADLGGLLRHPVAAVEGIAQIKHDGVTLESLPIARDDVWQTIRVYTRRSATVRGHALYTELTRCLREAGGAGTTTILGDWGFASDERPHGDRLGRVSSHRPTYSVYIDRPSKVAELWPRIDELTSEHGIVTSLFVPAYREHRADRAAELRRPAPPPRSGA
jgi:PII-like signaling protein